MRTGTRDIDDSPKRGVIKKMVILAATILAVSSCSSLPRASDRLAFDSDYWKSLYWEGDLDDRRGMIGDLVANVLPGKTKLEVIQLLGPPESRWDYWRENDYSLTYVAGWAGIDNLWIDIYFDDNFVYERYGTWSD